MLLDRYLAQTEFSSYEDFRDHFRIQVPDSFNFAYDVADEYARIDPDKVALVWCDEQGAEATFTFGQLKEQSDRAANVFRGLGIRKGDPVMLILKRRYEFWFCLLALHKLGAIAVPATHLLTAKDLIYRNNAASIRMVVSVAEPEVVTHIEAARSKSPTMATHVMVGAARPGWVDFGEALAQAAPVFEKPAGEDLPGNGDISLLYFT
ncbi:MAG TPA: AMP-binding protein, partial [Holophaga sp.]|nr:AMP-binding protein [Holophaga sp.]